jgi:predicted small integral membrane protein
MGRLWQRSNKLIMKLFTTVQPNLAFVTLVMERVWYFVQIEIKVLIEEWSFL